MTTTTDVGGLATVVIESPQPGPPLLTFVLLHGLAMEPSDLAGFLPALGLPVRYLLPTAPTPAQPRGYAWWPASQGNPSDAAIAPARAVIGRFLEAVPGRVVIGGFSQGAILIVDMLLRGFARCDGAVLLSAQLPNLSTNPSVMRRALPVLVTHGRTDDELPFSDGEAVRDTLEAAGGSVTWVPFDGGHGTPLPVWRAVRSFLGARIQRSG